MVSIERDNDISGGARESAFVGPAIPTMQFRNNVGTHLSSNYCRAIGRSVVDNDNLVDKRRYFPQYFSNADFLIETRYDYGDAAILVHLLACSRLSKVTARSGSDRYRGIVLE